MNQLYSSKNTSINTKKIPAIYKHIPISLYKNSGIFDYGCGKGETQEMVRKMLSEYGVQYYPFDPYNCTNETNVQSLCKLVDDKEMCVVCSNVLNVIKEDDIIDDIIKMFWSLGFSGQDLFVSNCKIHYVRHIYVSVYEGDKSGLGKNTKKDCWQRNQKTIDYLNLFNHWGFEHHSIPISMSCWESKYQIISNQKSLLRK